jgi:hypothetical protein
MVLVTGVSLAGEIQSASRGKVSFDNEELDVVRVDVEDIATLASPRYFEVQDHLGQVYRGSLQPADSGDVRVAGPGGGTVLRIVDIVEILAFDDGFWGRTNGYLDVGVNIARANFLSSYSLGTLFAYRGPRLGVNARWDGYWQNQVTQAPDGTEFEDAARRVSAQLNVNRYFSVWRVQGSATWERNDELDLESRFQAGLQGIYTFVENSAWQLGAGAGLLSNTEDYVGEDRTNTAEVTAGAAIDVFDLGNIDVYTLIQGYSTLGQERYRMKIDSRISWEIIEDFFLNFTVNENLDSAPPAEGSTRRDYRYGFSLGWSWG